MNRKEIQTKIEQKVAEIWHREDYPYDPDNIMVEISKDGSYVDISISSMYYSPGCTFAQMLALSEFFGTQEIGSKDDWARGGCDTCDYGSDYGFTLRIVKPKSGLL